MFTRSGAPNQVAEIERIVAENYKDDNYINVRFIGTLHRYDNRATSNATSAAITKQVKNVVAALAPIIVGLEAFFVNNTILKIIALLLTFFASLFGSDLAIFNAQSNLERYSRARDVLIHEFYLFYLGTGFYSDGADTTRNRQLFAINAEEMIGRLSEPSSWSLVRPQSMSG